MGIWSLSVRKKLMFSNFMMIFIPVLLILAIGVSVIWGLRLTGTMRHNEIALLWPEKGPALSIQLAVSSLRAQLDNGKGPKLKEVIEASRALEEQGIKVTVLNDNSLLYITPGAEVTQVQRMLESRYAAPGPLFLWDEEGFAFRYVSTKNKTSVMAVGDVPFLAPNGISEETFKDALEVIVFTVLGIMIFIIVATGLFLSRRLSKHLVKPLEELRQAAEEVGHGNLDYKISTEMNDEIGEACREFDKMRRQLELARESQERYEKNRKELIVGISHDLATPLTSVKGYASGLLDGIAQTPEKKRAYANMIYQTACNMEKLVESLFLFSKLDLGRVDFRMEPVDLKAYLWDYVTENRERLQNRGMNLTFDSNQQTELMVFIDRVQFQRVVENLVENSLKYKDGEISNLSIALKAGSKGHVFLKFADDGLGVAVMELEKLFESFYRTDPARSNVSKGSGLGLAIVKQIITTMRGEIWAEKGESKGLTICIYLPIYEEEKS